MADIFTVQNSTQSPEAAESGLSRAEELEQRQRRMADVAEKKAGETERGYEDFRMAVHTYEEALLAEADSLKRLRAHQEKKQVYAGIWDRAAEHAGKAWETKRQNLQNDAKAQESKLQAAVDAQKEERKRNADELEAEIQTKIREQTDIQQQLRQEQNIRRQRLDAAKTFIPSGGECPSPEAENMFRKARKNGYLTSMQEQACAMPVEEFCGRWIQTPQILVSSERKLIDCGFCQAVRECRVSKSEYNRFVLKITLAAFLVSLMLALPGILTQNGFLLLLTRVAAILAGAGVIGFAAMIFAIVRAFQSDTGAGEVIGLKGNIGILVIVISLVIGWISGGLVMGLMSSSLFLTFMAALFAALYATLVLCAEKVADHMKEAGFLVRKAFKNVFSHAEGYEDGQIIQRGEMSVLIACFIRHDEIMDCLTAHARAQMNERFTEEIDLRETQWKEAEDEKQRLRVRLNEVSAMREQNLVYDQQTDARAAAAREDIRRSHEAGEKPDFTLRSQLLPEDIRVLYETEKSMGLIPKDVQSRARALEAFENTAAEEKSRLNGLRERMREAVGVMKKWYAYGAFPPLKRHAPGEDGAAYRYAMESTLLYLSREAQEGEWKDGERPLVIRHDGNPICVSCSADAGSSRVMEVIREFWMAFSKNVPAELMRMALADPEEEMKMLYKGLQVETRPEFGQYAKDGPVPGQDGEVACLFGANAVRSFDEEVGRHVENCQEYFGRNRRDILRISGDERIFEKINRFRMEEGARFNPLPYYVVFIVVPEGRGDGVSRADPASFMKNMSALITDGMGRECGFLPVVVYTKDFVPKNWTRIVEAAEAANVICSL